MASKTKDRPLMLRKRRNGLLYLEGEWPPRHEFGLEWLLERTGTGEVEMTDTEIRINLMNASAVYAITARPAEIDEEGNRYTGYWAKLKTGNKNKKGA